MGKRGKNGASRFKGTFFKESFLISKEKEAAAVASVSNNTDENTTIEDTTSIHSIRKSSRKLTQYKSLDGRNCIICNEIKYEKGRKVSLLSMTLKKHGKENHQAEEALTKFANIHKSDDTKYKDAAQRILLQQNVSTLFAANVSYHKDCYQSFRSPYWERSSQKSKSDKITHDDESFEFFKLISYHTIERHEIYTLAQLRKAHDEFTKGTKLKSLDLKEMLTAKFRNNLRFVKSSYNTSSKTSEYVLSSGGELIADCINAAGEGIPLSVALRNIATRSISLDIQQRSKANPKLWPPVP